MVKPEGYDLIQDEHRANLCRKVAQASRKFGRYGCKAQIAWRGIEQDRADPVLVRPDHAGGGFRIIEGDDIDILEQSIGHPRRIADRFGWRGELLFGRVQADFGIVVGAMIAAFHFHDRRTASIGARGLDRRHHCFRTAIAEPDIFRRLYAITQQLGELDLNLGRVCVGCPQDQLLRHSLYDRRIGMAVDKRCKIVEQVEPRGAVNVGYICALAEFRVHRERLKPWNQTSNSARIDLEPAFVEPLRLGVMVRPDCHL